MSTTKRTPRPALNLGQPPIGRIPVIDVAPTIEDGRWPVKAVVGEWFAVEATVFREGHDAFGATAVLVDPAGQVHSSTRMVDIAPGLDRYQAHAMADATGDWGIRVEGWSDPWATWTHIADVKLPAGIDVPLVLAEGLAVLERAAAESWRPADELAVITAALEAASDESASIDNRIAHLRGAELAALLHRAPLREMVSTSPTYPLRVERPLALASAWYEMFVRSEGASRDPATGEWRSGTFATASRRLPQIAAMGFDIVYLTPVHPIGTTFRKGPNNTLNASPQDPGSPYAIGSPDGGHDAINPDLGTFADFDAFVTHAHDLGLEVALDLALQCSPDHPWVREHPQWFAHRPDGTIAYAENPPKKYQDIYPLSFDTDPRGLSEEILRIVELWISHGVTVFRVDNPHTKPLNFWEWLLASVRQRHPEVIFLAEAFTRPAMMHTLAKIGFQQSYSYFTWRVYKGEIEEYLREISGPAGAYMRPSFWPTTHDILPPHLQTGGTPAFALRAVLAATGSPSWGIYSGYELVENVPRPGVEEQIDNEKYEYRPRDWAQADHYGISRLITQLNRIRHAHPSLQGLRNLTVHGTTDDAMVAFSHHLPAEATGTGRPDTVITVVTLDPHNTRAGRVMLDLTALGLPPDAHFEVFDELSAQTYQWDATPYVELNPIHRVAHVLHVRS